MTIVPFPAAGPDGAARRIRTGKAMDVILHIGAHLCATSTFQDYLHRNRARLSAMGCAVWAPRRDWGRLCAGLMPEAGSARRPGADRRAEARIRAGLAACAGAGVHQLIVSDQGAMGSTRANLRLSGLYCGLGERLARLAQAFGGYPVRVVVNIRSFEAYWAAALAQAVTRGAGLPGEGMLARLAEAPRSWRDVIEEIAGALPGAEVLVLPYETFGARPEAQFEAMTGLRAPQTHARDRLLATPRLPELRAWLPADQAALLPPGKGRWHPFTDAQAAALRETYADDLMWIIGGASGLARLAEDPDKKQAVGPIPPQMVVIRGRRDDEEDRRLAGAG